MLHGETLHELRKLGFASKTVLSIADKVLDSIHRHMQESVNARDKLSKFLEKLDMSDATVKACGP